MTFPTGWCFYNSFKQRTRGTVAKKVQAGSNFFSTELPRFRHAIGRSRSERGNGSSSKSKTAAVKLCYMDDSEAERSGDAVNVVPTVHPIRWPAPAGKEACKRATRIQLSSQWRRDKLSK